MLVVGIDENGLGPRLGPLVATASLLEVEDHSLLSTDILPESKQVFTSGKRMEKGENLVLSFYSLLKGYIPSSPSQILSDLLLPLADTCTSPLPHCLPAFELPYWTAQSSIREDVAHHYLQKLGARLLEVKSVILCPAQLNKRLKSYNKNRIDYLSFEELMVYYREKFAGKEILFLCGAIGKTKDYSGFFSRLASLSYKTQREEDAVCYIFPSFAEVRFIENGDNKYFPIALSSLFGKYIRELFIEQLNRFFQSYVASLPHCSGYWDSTTGRFLEETAKLRQQLNIPEECFIRNK